MKKFCKNHIRLMLILAFAIVLIPVGIIYAASTITPLTIDDWNAVAQNTLEESSTFTIDNNYGTYFCLQAFLDSTTAHTGTLFRIQVSSADSGDEGWHDLPGSEFTALVGTANSEAITNDPLSAGHGTAANPITVADTGGNYETPPMGRWLAIEDSTLANSELIYSVAYSADTSVTVLDGVTNEHAQTTVMYDVAMSEVRFIPPGSGNRARLIINNTYDPDGSTLNYRLCPVEIEGL